MSIKLDTREHNVVVYDKVNYEHANGNNVVPLISSIRGDFKQCLFDIISNSLNLKESEKLLYKVITNYDITQSIVNINYVIKWIAKDTNMSSITYRRAAETLIIKGIIKYNEDRDFISIIPHYNINSIADNAKYIVIKIPTV